MRRLREAFIDAVTDGIIRAFLWLLRGQELPAMPVLPRTWDELCAAQPTWREPARRRCNEFQLLVLFRVDGTLAYALRTSPEPGHIIDTSFLN